MAKATTIPEFAAELKKFTADEDKILLDNARVALSLAAQRMDEAQKREMTTVEGLPFWEFRERTRQRVGIYAKVKFDTQRFQDIFDHYIHYQRYAHPSLASDKPNMIAYTKDHDGGERDIQVAMKMGRFLRKNITTEIASDDTVNAMANEFTKIRENANSITNGMFFADTPAEIVTVYRDCAVGSCMSYSADKWALEIDADNCEDLTYDQIISLCESEDDEGLLHPVAVYGVIKEIQCAYLVSEERIVARTLVNIEKKTFVRVYGNNHLKSMLLNKGYKPGHIYPPQFPYVAVVNGEGDTGIAAPYFDQYKEQCVRATVNVNHQTIELGTTGSIGLANYSSAMLMTRSSKTCGVCGHLGTSSLSVRRVYGHEATRACSACGTASITQLLADNNVIGLRYDVDGRCCLTYDMPEKFITVDVMPNHIAQMSPRSFITDRASGDLANNLYNYLRENAQLVEKIVDPFKLRLHKNSRDELIKDSITGKDVYREDTHSVSCPNGVTGKTAQDLALYIDADNKSHYICHELAVRGEYNSGIYEGMRWCAQSRPYLSSEQLWVHKSGVIDAIFTDNKDVTPAMPSECIFVLSTGEWMTWDYAVTNLSMERGEMRLEDYFKKYGKQFMKARSIYETATPDIFIRTFNFKDPGPDELKLRTERLIQNFGAWEKWIENIQSNYFFKEDTLQILATYKGVTDVSTSETTSESTSETSETGDSWVTIHNNSTTSSSSF